MFRPVLALALTGLAAAQPADGAKLRALDEWLAAYQRGKLDITLKERLLGKRNQAKAFVSIKYGLTDEAGLDRLSHEQELHTICAAVAEVDDARAASALLAVAAVGLDGGRYTAAMAPPSVRAVGMAHAEKLASIEAWAQIVEVAERGTGAAQGSLARQAAALRLLGSLPVELLRGRAETALRDGLGHDRIEVRLGAIDGFARLGSVCLQPFAGRLERETDERAVIRLLAATVAVAAASSPVADGEALRSVVDAALAGRGRFTWRSDLALIDLLERLRSARSIPALIELLAAAADGRTKSDTSTTVPARAHEVLRSLTGVVKAAADLDGWRQWWAEHGDGFTPQPAPAAGSVDPEATVANAFFGIPVTGRRVVFVVDTSASMMFPLQAQQRDRRGNVGIQGETKWDLAVRELESAVARLPPDAAFNLVTFNARAQAWKARLSPAGPAAEKAFRAYLQKLHPNGGTDLWGGLELALQPRSYSHGERLGCDADEVFVLSDGEPSTGDVVDPRQIAELVVDVNRVSRVRIHTVYVSGEEDQRGGGRGGRGGRGRGAPAWELTGEQLMKRLADENGGSHIRL